MKITNRHNVFDEVLQACIIFVYQKTQPRPDHRILVAEINERKDIGNPASSLSVPKGRVYQPQQFDSCFLCSNKEKVYSIWEKVRSSTKPLSSLGCSFTTGKIQWDLFKQRLTDNPSQGAARIIWAESVQRYVLTEARKRKGKEYLESPPTRPNITTDTIITQRTTADEQEYRIIATLFSPNKAGVDAFSENHTNYFQKTSNRLHLNYVLACLNSKLYDLIFRNINSNTQVSSGELNSLPFLDLPIAQQQPFIDIVDQIFAITKDEDYLANSAKQAKVKEYERQIDQMVYQLYDLTPEEIAVVEGFSNK